MKRKDIWIMMMVACIFIWLMVLTLIYRIIIMLLY